MCSHSAGASNGNNADTKGKRMQPLTEKAIKAREILDRDIAQGQAKAEGVLQRIEKMAIIDTVLEGKEMEFGAYKGRLILKNKDRGIETTLHPNAVRSAVGRTVAKKRGDASSSVAKKVQDWVFQEDTMEEAASMLTKKYQRLGDTCFLIRDVEEETRFVGSASYGRFNAQALFAAALQQAMDHGAIPIDAHLSDLTASVNLMLPQLLEPVPGEPFIIGSELRTSDFGAGATHLAAKVRRMWCTNGMISENFLRRAHLSSTLSKDIEWSERTHRLDTETMCSKVTDMTDAIFSKENLLARCALIKKSAQEDPDYSADKELDKLFKRNRLQKGEREDIAKTFSSADTVMVPAGNSPFRLSQAIALRAKTALTAERRTELEKLAGEVGGLCL
jgi:hypothetical protein